MFPVVQPDGEVKQLEESILKLSKLYKDDIRIFPGHGKEIKSSYFIDYLDMIEGTKTLVLKAIKDGKLPDESKKDDILKNWRSYDSKLFVTLHAENWIDNLYASLDEGKEMSAIYVLRREYNRSGLYAMVELYKKISSVEKRLHIFNEVDFNRWGYELLAMDKTQDAIEVFKINIEIFPNSANAFDSYGEVYMNLGSLEFAKENYRKSLDLNPQNTNAEDQLFRINEIENLLLEAEGC